MKLVKQSDRTMPDIAVELGISAKSVGEWVRNASESETDHLSEDERAELKRLRQGKSMRFAFIDVEKTSYPMRILIGRGTYGSPRVLRELGLQGVSPRRFRVTTNSDHEHPIAENALARNFEASGPSVP
ncbi:MAG: hypothetical protein H8E78_02825 [Proteobacteria bacterium]|nr:hypothetical protein [Pseudomonadota bacterium]